MSFSSYSCKSYWVLSAGLHTSLPTIVVQAVLSSLIIITAIRTVAALLLLLSLTGMRFVGCREITLTSCGQMWQSPGQRLRAHAVKTLLAMLIASKLLSATADLDCTICSFCCV